MHSFIEFFFIYCSLTSTDQKSGSCRMQNILNNMFIPIKITFGKNMNKTTSYSFVLSKSKKVYFCKNWYLNSGQTKKHALIFNRIL